MVDKINSWWVLIWCISLVVKLIFFFIWIKNICNMCFVNIQILWDATTTYNSLRERESKVRNDMIFFFIKESKLYFSKCHEKLSCYLIGGWQDFFFFKGMNIKKRYLCVWSRKKKISSIIICNVDLLMQISIKLLIFTRGLNKIWRSGSRYNV